MQQKRVLVSLYRTMLKIVRDIDGEAHLNPSIRRIIVGSSNTSSDITLAAHHIVTRSQLQDWIRGQFRSSRKDDAKQRIHDAISGVQRLEQLFHSLQRDQKNEETTTTTTVPPDLPSIRRMEDKHCGIIDEVEWLPSIDEMLLDEILKDTTPQQTGSDPVVFPMFPLMSTFLEQDISYYDFPTPGCHPITLKIFEPRYRKMYEDMITTTASGKQQQQRQFVLPFAHPTVRGKFASHGLLLMLTHVREVADETNGLYQYVGNHIATKPIQIDSVLNPRDYQTKETYLKVKGHVLDHWTDENFPDVRSALERRINQGDDYADNLMKAWKAEGIWGLVRFWMAFMQRSTLDMEMKMSLEMQMHSKMKADPKENVREWMLDDPDIYKRKMQIITTIPKLLQGDKESNSRTLIQMIEATPSLR